jgi:hypothetical protein
MGQVGKIYGQPNHAQVIYEQITRAAPDLRGRLRALVQLSHASTDPATIEAVRGALFEAHGYNRHE